MSQTASDNTGDRQKRRGGDSMISENLVQVRKNIVKACERAGRDPDTVSLIAVSKTKPVAMLREAYDAGCRDFGENKVQEIMDKFPVMSSEVRWHMIGHLQRNKVKYIVDKAALIHSVDSLRLAEEISREASKRQIRADILLEVNIAGESSKFGVLPQDTENLAREISALPSLQIKGLMTVAPFVENPEDNRQYFARLRQLSVDIGRKNIDNVNMNVLSMGMTGDYMVAVEEGATIVRVGTGIFGERQYPVK